MCEFHPILNNYFVRTRRRVIKTCLATVLLTGIFLSEWSQTLPIWFKVLVISLCVFLIVFDLAYYPKGRKLAGEFKVVVFHNALGFPHQGDIKKIPYADLAVSGVKKKSGNVVSIRLKTSYGHTINLTGLERMNALYDSLSSRLD